MAGAGTIRTIKCFMYIYILHLACPQGVADQAGNGATVSRVL